MVDVAALVLKTGRRRCMRKRTFKISFLQSLKSCGVGTHLVSSRVCVVSSVLSLPGE